MDFRNVVDNVSIYGIEDSFKASKYPMCIDVSKLNSNLTDTIKKLGKTDVGSGHDQFLTGIIVQFDLTFSIKAWTEAERYHFLDFVSSQSTMHKITKFKLEDQCNSYVDSRIINIVQEKINEYNRLAKMEGFSEERKEIMDRLYLEILYNVPTGFRLTARMTTNYRQLKTIYYQRNNHRLPEWREFCKWILTLPNFVDLCIKTI